MYFLRKIFVSLLLTFGLAVVNVHSGYAQSSNPAIEVWLSNYNANNITGYNALAFSGPQPGDNPPALTVSNGVQGPEDIVQDASGNLWISNVYNGTVVGYTPPFNSAPSYVISLGLGSIPTGIAFDHAGNLYAATLTGNAVHVFNNPTTNTNSLDSYIVEGSKTQLSWPVRIAFDSSGNMYVADAIVGAIVFAPIHPTTDPNCDGSSGVPVCDVVPKYTLSWRPNASANGLSLDTFGNLFVTDSQENAIVMFSKRALDACAAIGGNCTTPPSASISGPNTGLDLPAAVSVAAGQTFVCNQSNNGANSSVTVYNNTALYGGGTQDLAPIAIENGAASGVVDCNGILAVAVGPVKFANFSGKLQIASATGTFDLNSTFTLGSGSNGINPVAEDVILSIAGYSVTIPKGSFTRNKQGAYVFEGAIGNVPLQFRINPSGTNAYTLQAEGNGASLGVVSNPIPVTLTIGDDAGTTQIDGQIS